MKDYYFYISAEEYSNFIDANKKVKFLFLFNVILLFLIFLIVITSIYAINKDAENKFRGIMMLFLLVPLLLAMIKAQHTIASRYKMIRDIWINENGIHLPFPLSLKDKKYFIKFDDINKIEVWKYPKNIRYSTIHIFLNFTFKPDSIFQPNNKTTLTYINPNSFISAIKKATNDSIKIQIKTSLTSQNNP